MEFQIKLDALTERYVRSKEVQAEWWQARAWSMLAAGFTSGTMFGLLISIWFLR